MENSKVLSNTRTLMYPGKHPFLPPKIPFPSASSSSFSDYVPNGPNPIIGSRVVQFPREGNMHHHRASSESFLMEEQPSWLDDLLNEPETPVRRGGHRRSSSDSFTYVDALNVSMEDYAAQDDLKYKNMISRPSWASLEFDLHKNAHHASSYTEANLAKQKTRTWESPSTSATNPSARPSGKNNIFFEGSRPISTPLEANISSTTTEKQDIADTVQDPKSSERIDGSHVKLSTADTDNKRAKQQFAQRSRVRKLQYIAELERNVQVLQSEGSEVSAELDFLSQQNLILSMENKALKQRLESISQEQLIKYLEHEVLEREIGRLRVLYQQQLQQPQQPSPGLKRTKSRDLDTQFANLSLKQKDVPSGRKSVTGPVHI